MINFFERLFSKKNRRILIIVGGDVGKIATFAEPAKKLRLDVTPASFSELNFSSEYPFRLKIGDSDICSFDIIYIRMVGRRLEDATLLINYAAANRVKIVDKLYKKSLFIPSSIIKSQETQKLISAGVNIPRTIFGSLAFLRKNCPEIFGFPFVVKSTTGRRSREVWLVENKSQLKNLMEALLVKEKEGIRFFAQEFIPAGQRVRVLVIGGKAIGAITRPAKWRTRFIGKINGEYPEGIRKALIPIPQEDKCLAVLAAGATDLDICGVDILHDDKSGRAYVIETNAAPAWRLIAKDCGINVEEEILKFLTKV